MKIELNIEKKYAFGIIATILIFTGIFAVYAYNANGQGGVPVVMGHSADELSGVCKTDGTGCPSSLNQNEIPVSNLNVQYTLDSVYVSLGNGANYMSFPSIKPNGFGDKSYIQGASVSNGRRTVNYNITVTFDKPQGLDFQKSMIKFLFNYKGLTSTEYNTITVDNLNSIIGSPSYSSIFIIPLNTPLTTLYNENYADYTGPGSVYKLISATDLGNTIQLKFTNVASQYGTRYQLTSIRDLKIIKG